MSEQNDRVQAALDQLEKLSRLPPELNAGSKAKCVLAEVVFEPAKVERHVDASAILRGWQEPIGEAELNEALGPDGGELDFAEQFRLSKAILGRIALLMLVVSCAVLAAFILLELALVGRLFKAALLQAGQPIRLRDLPRLMRNPAA